jgi:membrane associated rhomboid family serine protease
MKLPSQLKDFWDERRANGIELRLRGKPVTKLLLISVIVIFLLYFTTVLKETPCGNTFSSVFMSNFIHTDFYHLFGNVLALYGLSRMEEKLGIKKFIMLTVYLLVMNSVIEVSLHKVTTIPCGIGFSGVIFGFIAFEMMTEQKIDLYLGLSVLSMVMGSMGKNTSLMGHAVGAFSGLLSGMVVRSFNLLPQVAKQPLGNQNPSSSSHGTRIRDLAQSSTH